MTSITQRRVAGATALMILMYLLQVALLATPSQADTHSPNDPGYWLARYPDAITCYKYTGDAAHGTLVDGGKAVELAVHQDDWVGDHWEVLIVNGGADDGGDGNGNAVYEHPHAGVAYYPPLNAGDQDPLVSHWIVCKGYDYDIDGTPSFDIAACDEQGLTSVKFTVQATTEVTIGGVAASESDPAFQPGDHELDLVPGTYSWILFSPIGAGIERERGTFTVDECDTTTTTQGSTTTTTTQGSTTTTTTQGSTTTTTTQGSTTTTQGTSPTTVVTQTVPTTTTLPFDSVPEEVAGDAEEVTDDEVAILGTTVTTAASTAPEEVSADTLPFTGSESGDVVRFALLVLVAGSLMLAAVRGPKEEEVATDLGGWSQH